MKSHIDQKKNDRDMGFGPFHRVEGVLQMGFQKMGFQKMNLIKAGGHSF